MSEETEKNGNDYSCIIYVILIVLIGAGLFVIVKNQADRNTAQQLNEASEHGCVPPLCTDLNYPYPVPPIQDTYIGIILIVMAVVGMMITGFLASKFTTKPGIIRESPRSSPEKEIDDLKKRMDDLAADNEKLRREIDAEKEKKDRIS